VLFCTFYIHTTLYITLLHPFLVALRCDCVMPHLFNTNHWRKIWD
jgi:hypothetical protein